VIDRPARDDARRLARLQQQNQVLQQRNRHLRLAIELTHDERAASAKIARARERVALWRSKRSCSPFYIERWSRLLTLPPRKLAKAMASLGEWEDAFFQNSPWSGTYSQRPTRASPRSPPAPAARRSSGAAARTGDGRG
jgi:hypothetical protein